MMTRTWALAMLLVSCGLVWADEQPDVVVILADDLGWQDVGYSGSGAHETPNIDRLRRHSLSFPNAYSDGPNCAPTRASMLTGLATPRHGIITVNSSSRGKAANRKLEPVENRTTLDESFVTVPALLQAAGYRTVHVGKFHVGDDPLNYGFTDQVGGTSKGHPASYHVPYKNSALPDGLAGEYLTDRMAAEAINFIRSDDERPLFMNLWFYTVHSPFQARSDLFARAHERAPSASKVVKKYNAMVMAMDEAIGRVLEAIEKRGRETVIIFSSDNGGNGLVAQMGPLRGAKGMLYEGGIRVPLLVHDGRATHDPTQRGGTCNTPVLLRDLAPTILAIAGADRSGTARSAMDARSILPAIDGHALPTEHLHWHFPVYLEGKKASRPDEPPHGPWRTAPVAAVRDGRWKLMEFFEDSRLELYDLEGPNQDRCEWINLAEEHPEHVARLHASMLRFRETVGARLPTPKPTKAPSENR